MTLHEAIKQVLLDSKRSMTATEIAGIINSAGLYKRGDNKSVPPSQINSRVNNYLELFEKNGKQISLFHISETQVQFALWKILDSQRGELIHGSDSLSNVITIPLCFFFKRILDNVDLLINTFHKPLQIICDYNGFLQFLGLLEETYPDLKLIISEISLELNKQRNFNLEKLLTDLTEIDLRRSHLPDKVFSELYINIIGTVSKRNFNLGLFTTPDTLAELIAGLAILFPLRSIYNPATGIGTLPVMIRRNNQSIEFFFKGEEINSHTYLLAFTNLIINKININDFHLFDSLKIVLKKQYDLIVCNPPVNAILSKEYSWKDLPSTNKSHLVFLGSILSKLKSKGRAIILMPEGFLFSQDNIEKEFKRYILNHSLLEGIISLPAGLFLPDSGIKTSLLILNSNRINEFTYLIDAENLYLLNKPEKNEINLETKKIISIIQSSFKDVSKHEIEDQLSEPVSYYHSDYFAIKNLNPQELNLSVKRYLLEDNPSSDTKNWVRLGDVFDYYWQSTKGHDTKYINTSGLNVNYFDFKLDISKQPFEIKPGSYLDKEAVLIGSIVGSYKPSYFDGSEPVVISQNIHILTLKPSFKNKILPEYIIYELANKSFIEKLDRFATGSTSLKRVSKADLLNARIYLPSIEEQASILNTKKEAIIDLKTNEVANLKGQLNLPQKEIPDYLGFVEHELGNIAGGVNNYVKTLKSFIKTKNIDFELKVTERRNSLSVKEVFESLERNMADIKSLLDNLKKILEVSNASLNLAETNYFKFISEECSKQNHVLSGFRIIIGTGNNNKDLDSATLLIDRDLFTLVIRNFLINSAKHGYVKDEINKTIFINLTEDEDFKYLNLMNNGNPFPKSITQDSFVEFGKRSGDTQGSGLGGFIMAQIVKKHGGKLTVITEERIMHISSESQKEVLKMGVYIQIQLPKNI
ncbi:MAG: N-6 DNA methylase [Bacteroidota bacterium]